MEYSNITVLLGIFVTFMASVRCDIMMLPEFYWDEDECATPESKHLQNPQVPWNTPNRAYQTLPDGLRIENSSIAGSGLGVFSDIFIAKYTWLAEYEGEVVLKLDHISDYAWKVKRSGKKYFYVDAHDPDTSNWLRGINFSRHWREENVEVLECRGKMYYVTNKDVHPGQELFIYYGDTYASQLGIDTERYEDATYYAAAMLIDGYTMAEES